jgi:hypothetical protein
MRVIQAADTDDPARTVQRNGRQVLTCDEQDDPGGGVQEHANFAFDGEQGVMIAINSGKLASGATPQNEQVQGACYPVRLVPDSTSPIGVAIEPNVSEFKYLTKHNADESRTFHSPTVNAIGNGLFLIQFNWDIDDTTNTDRYAMVVDGTCSRVTLSGNTPRRQNNTIARIMAKDNDNCAGVQSGNGCDTFVRSDGTVDFACGQLCNGNGEDDGWLNYFSVSCDSSGTSCEINKHFDTSIIEQEERSRPQCEQVDSDGDGTPDHAVCCGTEGNSQPQREGVWCAAVNLSSGARIWRKRMAYTSKNSEGQTVYAMRAKLMRPEGLTQLVGDEFRGIGNDVFYLHFEGIKGGNAGQVGAQNRKGGIEFGSGLIAFRFSTSGPEVLGKYDISQNVIDAKVGVTHSVSFVSLDASGKPVLSFAGGSINAGTGGSGVLNIGLDAQGAPVQLPPTRLLGTYDTGLYSNLCGENPRNQGRNYAECGVISNPFANVSGPSQGIQFFNMCAYTGKLPEEPISTKLSLMAELWSPQALSQANAVTDPGSASASTPEDGSNAADQGGCSAASRGANSGLALLVGIGLVFGLRRRRR